MFSIAIAQAVASVPALPAGPPLPSPCDLRDKTAEDIVVCGKREERQNRYRIKPVPTDGRAIPEAKVKLGDGVTASAETESADVGGFPSNRAMVRLKIGF